MRLVHVCKGCYVEYLKEKDNVYRLSPRPTDKNEEEDFIPVYMLTDEIPADSATVAELDVQPEVQPRRGHHARFTNGIRGIVLPRVKKRLSSIISGLLDVQRGNQCRKRSALQITATTQLRSSRKHTMAPLDYTTMYFLGAQRTASQWISCMLVFAEGGKPKNPEKNPRNREENQHKLNPLMASNPGIEPDL